MKKISRAEVDGVETIISSVNHRLSEVRFSAKVLRNRNTTLARIYSLEESIKNLKEFVDK